MKARSRVVLRLMCVRASAFRLAIPVLATLALAAMPLAALPGCGLNVDEVAFQTASATGRTIFDILLTDLLNAVASAAERDGDTPMDGDAPEPPADGDGDTPPPDGSPPDGSPPDGSPPGGSPFDDLTGDALDGELVFMMNGCAACHCDDASGGCALDAPGLAGSSAFTIAGRLRGNDPHPVSQPDLRDQAMVDLEAYFASLDGGAAAGGGAAGDGGDSSGDSAAGGVIFADNGCAACHCADATGGCALGAPPITGVDRALLADELSGAVVHTGGSFALTDADLDDLLAYLASL